MDIKLIANFKMHFSNQQMLDWCQNFISIAPADKLDKIVLAPADTNLSLVKDFLNQRGINIRLASQNAVSSRKVALTGEVSVDMLEGLADYLIIGHSEQRTFNPQTDEELALRIHQAVKLNITPVICFGDSLEDFEAGDEFIYEQVQSLVNSLEESELKKIIIAYEPIWAIGSGKLPTALQIDTKLKLISGIINSKISETAYVFDRMLYGGSVSSSNIGQLKESKLARGFLIGGASLDFRELAKLLSLV